MWVEVTSLWVWNSFVVRRLWVPVFGVVGGFCGCVMGVMGLWFVFGGWGWVLFSFVAGTGCGSDGCGFWSCLLGCGWLVVMGG